MKFLLINNYDGLLKQPATEMEWIFKNCEDSDELLKNFLRDVIKTLLEKKLINLILIHDYTEVDKTVKYIMDTYNWVDRTKRDGKITLLNPKDNKEYKVYTTFEFLLQLEDICEEILSNYLNDVDDRCKINLNSYIKNIRGVVASLYNTMVDYIIVRMQ